jgi:enoyl-CoA hydratase/carnithine racemase/predicted RNase H-like HicB family nuclease
MLIEFFLERALIELSEDRLSYRGYVPDLPEIRASAATAEQCRAKLAGAISAVLAIESRRGATGDSEHSSSSTESLDLAGHSPESDQSSEFSDIIYEKRDGIARVTINRPSAYNTYTDHTLREMASAFRDAARDPSVAALVLTGAGERAFCAGGDVRQHKEEHIGNPQAVREWMTALMEAHAALRELGKPSIARINGMAAGGGNEWNLACDLAIAADHAKFVQVETKVGLVAAAGAAHWLPLLIGERRAREVFLTGEPISANKALLWGLVNDVVPYKQLDKTIASLCNKLIDRFPESTRNTREQLSFWKDLPWNALASETHAAITVQFAGQEASEGMRALVEKREVDYASFRVSPRIADDQAASESVSAASSQNSKATSRVCYSCGAGNIPPAYEYCGICGTRIL